MRFSRNFKTFNKYNKYYQKFTFSSMNSMTQMTLFNNYLNLQNAIKTIYISNNSMALSCTSSDKLLSDTAKMSGLTSMGINEIVKTLFAMGITSNMANLSTFVSVSNQWKGLTSVLSDKIITMTERKTPKISILF